MKTSVLSTVCFMLLVWSAGSAQTERSVTETFEMERDGKVSIDTYKGSIHVEVWDKDAVFLEARIELADKSDEAEEAVKLVDIEIESRSGAFHVETSYDRLNRWRKRRDFWDNLNMELPSVHYTLKIPEKAPLTVDDYKSTSEISGLSSDLIFETYKGDAVVKDHEGRVHLETYKGDVKITFRHDAHESSFETYKGDIVVLLPRETAFDVRLDLGRRVDLRTDFPIEDREWGRRREHHRYRERVNGGGPVLRFESTKGTIRIDEI